MTKTSLKDNRQLREQMYEYLDDCYGGAIAPSWSIQQMLDTAYSFKEAEKHYKELKNYITVKEESKILDVGSGFGYFVSYCLAQGHDTHGYEIDKRLIEIGNQLLTLNKQNPQKIKFVKTKKLPFKDNSFDLIYLHFILDCVQDIPFLMKELKRILKKDGVIFTISPNYLCGYSPVYALFFIPWLPRVINRMYFKLMGRPSSKFFDGLNFVTPRSLEKIFQDLDLKVNNVGIKYWENMVTGKQLANRSNTLKKLVKVANQTGTVYFLKLSAKAGFYTPLVYSLSKDKAQEK